MSKEFTVPNRQKFISSSYRFPNVLASLCAKQPWFSSVAESWTVSSKEWLECTSLIPSHMELFTWIPFKPTDISSTKWQPNTAEGQQHRSSNIEIIPFCFSICCPNSCVFLRANPPGSCENQWSLLFIFRISIDETFETCLDLGITI